MGDFDIVVGDEDVILSTALAFTLEFFQSEKPPLNVSMEKKPAHYFNSDTVCDDMDDDYTPQYDHMKSTPQPIFNDYPVNDYLNNNDIEIISQTVSTSSSEHPQTGEEIIFEKLKTPPRVKIPRVGRPKNNTLSSVKTAERAASSSKSRSARQRPEPTRGSSRLLIQRLAREEDAKKKKKSAPPPKRKPPAKKTSPSRKREPAAERRKREKEERARADALRKQRKAMAEATKSVARAFGCVASVQCKTGKLHLHWWTKWMILSSRYIRDLASNPEDNYDTAELHVFLVNSITVMQNTLISYRPRPNETHELMLVFIGDFIKIWNVASGLGAKNVTGDIGRLLECVMGHFIAHPKRMNPTNLPWVQTKVILDKILSIITRVEVIYDTMILLNKMMGNFLGRWARRSDENLEFKSYVLATFHSFFTILNGRLTHMSLQEVYRF